ncbi:MAG: hypothetical protein Q9157_006347 [Trypethelium eluteriae]
MSEAQLRDHTTTEQGQRTSKPQAKTTKDNTLSFNFRRPPGELWRSGESAQRRKEAVIIQDYIERKSKGKRKTAPEDRVHSQQQPYGIGSRVDPSGRINRPPSNNFVNWPLAPEDILFRANDAPIRYEEDDLYFQNEKLGPAQRLPDSDLLKAIHAYASDYYFCNTVDEVIKIYGGRKEKIKGRGVDFVSMDETALLTMGILMEEAARERLGKTGDLALVEADDEDEREWPMAWNGKEWVKSAIEKKDLSRRRARGQRNRAVNGENQRKRARTEESEENQEVIKD